MNYGQAEREGKSFIIIHSISLAKMEIEIVGRILKRHHYSKNMIFYDVVVAPIDFTKTYPIDSNVTLKQHMYTFVSVSIQRNNEGGLFPKAVVGDIIKVKGLIHNQQEFLSHTQRLSVDVDVDNVEIVGSVSLSTPKAESFFTFDKVKMGKDFQTYDLVELQLPTMAIQVGLKQLERFVVAFCDIFGDIYDLRESATGYSNSSDRLLVFRAKCNDQLAVKTTYEQTIAKLISNPTLGPAILRIYPGLCGAEVISFCSTQLHDIVVKLLDHAQKHASVYRLQCYPKALMNQILLIDGSLSDHIPLHPTQFSHMVYIFLCDGVWVVSVVPKEDCFIGDLREHKPKDRISTATAATTVNTSEPSTASSVTICRAGAKIEEIMRRKHWLFDFESDNVSENSKHKYRLAVDVGASPGGWSYFLATDACVERVIAIDKGELRLPEPWPEQLYYWAMLGEEAMQYLDSLAKSPTVANISNENEPSFHSSPPRSPFQHHADSTIFSPTFLPVEVEGVIEEKRKIDLYCCDANIPPTETVAILLNAVRLQLLAENARIILTFKNPFGKKDAWFSSVRESLDHLKHAGFVEIEELHLLANTAKETTVTSVFRPFL